jgi:hypothetical protein
VITCARPPHRRPRRVATPEGVGQDATMTNRPNTAVILLLSLVLTLGASALTARSAAARPRPSGGRAFVANKEFGLGLMLGAPTGLSGKYFLSGDRALDFGVGVIGYYRGRDGLHLHMDYLWHPVSLVSVPEFELPLYFGIGGRFFDFEDDTYDAFAFGVRAPIGISFDLTNVPLDIFLELALVVDFFSGYRDDIGADLNGAVGLRYYFK